MTQEEIKKAYMSNEELGIKELGRIIHQVAEFKRYLEAVTMIPGALEESESDYQTFQAKYKIEEDWREAALWLLDAQKAGDLQKLSTEKYMETVPEIVFRYNQFLGNKIAYRDTLRNTVCVPKNPAMKKWRDRQIERSKGISGSAYTSNVQLPIVFELSDGCSVGCEFCAIGAEKLKSVFRYTPENRKLFLEVLDAAIEIIGPAAAGGVLYYCCEALDNPDYELFAEDYYAKCGYWPQITTAVALRKPERTHKLLFVLNQRPNTIYRFSVLNVTQAEQIFEEFTPDELLRVELIPQYPEATTFMGFAKAGRARDTDTEDSISEENGSNIQISESICCISGFVVNMANQTIRLLTMANADDRFPTGEAIYETVRFADAEDFRKHILRMIETYMKNDFPRSDKLKVYDYFKIQNDLVQGPVLRSKGYLIGLNSLPGRAGLRTAELLMKGGYTASEIASELSDKYSIDPVDVYWVLHFLWQKGVIDEFYRING